MTSLLLWTVSIELSSGSGAMSPVTISSKYQTKLLYSRLDQYAIAKFAESFEMIPKTLAENAGLNAIEIISPLYAEHASGNTEVGVDLDEGVCKDFSTMNIWDLHITKFFALKYAAMLPVLSCE